MRFKTATQDQINGTHLQGYITADYDELTAVFGEPTSDGDGYKVDAEWDLVFADGTVATIYNWKNGHNYLGEEGLPPECITRWHIGGHSSRNMLRPVSPAVRYVEDALFDHRNGCDTVDEKPAGLLTY